MRKPAVAASAALHILGVLFLLSLTYQPAQRNPIRRTIRIVTLRAPRSFAKEGGGGQRQPLPASLGRAPQMSIRRAWIPPMIVRIESPRLTLEQALLETPVINIESAVTGDPLGSLGPLSGGPGGPGGFGAGGPDGIGDAHGSRQGSPVSPKPPVKLSQRPQLLYKEDPEYSEEARKARFEGTVILELDVDVSGRPTNIRVVRSLGLGLDERAVAAVRHWKFRPAVADNQPVSAPAQVEVTFRLL